ncbi:MAG: sugar phosphate isomerase/epimerase family protein, partial [Planctomycetota bacterium]
MLSLDRCAVHTRTNKPWSLAECCEAYASKGIGGVSVWQDAAETVGLREAAAMVRGSGLRVPAYVRGGFFTARGDGDRAAAIDTNRRLLDDAAVLGAEMLVLVVGATPGLPLAEARKQVAAAIETLLPHAETTGVKLAIEPLHPMYADDKSCINRAADARAICERLDSPMLGVALDVYHTWWDPDLEHEIERLGANKQLFGFHVCDWKQGTTDLLTDRGLMGDGCIDVQRIRAHVETAGFDGLVEVEVFSDAHEAAVGKQVGCTLLPVAHV